MNGSRNGTFEVICETCGKQFVTYKSNNKKYCSQDCYWKRGREKVTCKNCGKAFISPKFEKRVYCSRECLDSRELKRVQVECAYCHEIFEKTLTQMHVKTHFCNNDCKHKYFADHYDDWSNNDNQWGQNNPSWKGGITPERIKLRATPEYKEWRKKILKRDQYKCQRCGSDGLVVHHIKPVNEDVKLLLDDENGITLCEKCHIEVHGGSWKSLKEIPVINLFGEVVGWRAI